MVLRMVSATTGQCFIKCTDKSKVELPQIHSNFAQVMSDPTQMDLQL